MATLASASFMKRTNFIACSRSSFAWRKKCFASAGSPSRSKYDAICTYCSEAPNSCPTCSFIWRVSLSEMSIVVWSALRFLFEHLHRHTHQPVQLLVGGLGQQRLGPHVVLGVRVAVEEAADVGDQGDALELGAALGVGLVLGRAQQRLEAVG